MAGTNGKRPIDLIKATFDSAVRRFEWPGVPGLVLYFPPITPARWSKARTMADAAGKADDTNELGIRLLVVSAQLEDGQQAFQVGDVAALRTNTKVTELQEVVNFVLETGPEMLTDPSVIEAEELVKADPT